MDNYADENAYADDPSYRWSDDELDLIDCDAFMGDPDEYSDEDCLLYAHDETIS